MNAAYKIRGWFDSTWCSPTKGPSIPFRSSFKRLNHVQEMRSFLLHFHLLLSRSFFLLTKKFFVRQLIYIFYEWIFFDDRPGAVTRIAYLISSINVGMFYTHGVNFGQKLKLNANICTMFLNRKWKKKRQKYRMTQWVGYIGYVPNEQTLNVTFFCVYKFDGRFVWLLFIYHAPLYHSIHLCVFCFDFGHLRLGTMPKWLEQPFDSLEFKKKKLNSISAVLFYFFYSICL